MENTKVKRYEEVILSILHGYAESWRDDYSKAIVIADTKSKHYQLLNIGWQGHEHIFYVSFHLNIENEKVWIQENRTDILLADELIEQGIPKTDIVLGVQPPSVRPHTGFAVA